MFEVSVGDPEQVAGPQPSETPSRMCEIHEKTSGLVFGTKGKDSSILSSGQGTRLEHLSFMYVLFNSTRRLR